VILPVDSVSAVLDVLVTVRGCPADADPLKVLSPA
jgi:hypothetical protein